MSKDSVYFALNEPLDQKGVKKIQKELGAMDGVLSVTAGSQGGMIVVDFDSTGTESGQIEKKLQEMGYEISSQKLDRHMM